VTGRGEDVVIFGGQDHKTEQAGDTNGCFERLERRLDMMVRGVRITHRSVGTGD
jgi:hypothetical protein